MQVLATHTDWDAFEDTLATSASRLLLPPKPDVLRVPNLERAPNIIEWTIERRFLNLPAVIDHYVRQYQVLRDIFQLRCPVCNSMKPEAIDSWGKSRMELESETLMRWSADLNDDVCPGCRTTRAEFELDGMLQRIDTSVGVCGMRCVHSTTAILTKERGLVTVGDLHRDVGGVHRPDTFTPVLDELHVWDGSQFSRVSHVYFAGCREALELVLDDEFRLVCSAIHPVRDQHGNWVEVQKLKPRDLVQTANGLRAVIEVKKCEAKQYLYDLHVPTTHAFMANGIVSHNSGKSVKSGIVGTYFEHECSVIGDIHKYFGILEGDTLQISFVATTAAQAEETVYTKYRAARAASPWFQKYVAWVKEQEKVQSTPPGMQRWEYKETDGEIHNPLIDLSIKSLNSNSAGLAGATRIAAFIDELSRFDTTDSKRSADEIVKVMNQGLKTVRGARDRLKLRHFWGLLAATSSPISIDDKAMVMVREKVSRQYSFHYSTWDFNPDLPRNQFDGDFERDPIGAMRDFGAQPPNAETPYIDDEARFRRIIEPTAGLTARFEVVPLEDQMGHRYVGARLVDATLDLHHSHYLHFDAGESFDTFAGASAHGEWIESIDPDSGLAVRRWITVFDWVLGIKPVLGKTLEERRIVYFDSIVQIIEDLAKKQRIARVTFDRWNSVKIMQDIRAIGIGTDKQSIGYQEFIGFSKAAYDGQVRYPATRGMAEPNDVALKFDHEKALYELLRLERSKDLKRIYNSKKGRKQGENSDDLAQAVVGAHIGVQSSVVVGATDSHSAKEVLRREQAQSNHNASTGNYNPGNNNGAGRIARTRRW